MKTGVKWFPIMGRRAIPWALIIAHEKQAKRNHGGQTLERLAQRGGLEASEACAVLEDREWRGMARDVADQRLDELVFEAAQEAIFERHAAVEAVGEAWFAGGATLAEAIERKCARLEESIPGEAL